MNKWLRIDIQIEIREKRRMRFDLWEYNIFIVIRIDLLSILSNNKNWRYWMNSILSEIFYYLILKW